MKNNLSYAKTISVYSYIYDGNTLLSDGYDGTKWRKELDANKQEIVLEHGAEKNISLANRLKNNTKEGKYKFRIRVLRNGIKEDTTNDIIVKLPETEKNITKNAENVSRSPQKTSIDSNETFEDIMIQQSNPIGNEITGNVIDSNPDNNKNHNQTAPDGIETKLASIKNWFFNIIDNIAESLFGFFGDSIVL